MANTATETARKLDISRSYLYYLKEKDDIEFDRDKNGKVIWNDNTFAALESYLSSENNMDETQSLTDSLKTIGVNNRRYLGNKYKLLDFIKRIVDQECEDISTVADIFSGTGAVASAFTSKKLITNDIMYSNYICHIAWFSPEEYDESKVSNLICYYNSIQPKKDNYMSENFADTYFSKKDCIKIGYIRDDIEKKTKSGFLNERERALLITSLLYGMDKIANTCGHYDAYRKGVEFSRTLELALPVPDKNLNRNNVCYNKDTNELVKHISADLVYIDPPYNSRQYCDAYHLLENVARWEKPEVYGVAKKMDRTTLKSDYCTNKATIAFEELVNSIDAKYILLSYNNMAGKGNDRSNAKIQDDDIIRVLEAKGKVKVFSESYKPFSAGKSNILQNEERLFLCICDNKKKDIIPSALNYTGGKYKLLDQILPLFPKKIDTAVDLFCGGCNVGINVSSNKVIFNDSNEALIGIYNAFRELDKEYIFNFLYENIDKYNLSMVCNHGYEFYGCKSSSGLGSFNKEGFIKLRRDFNSVTNKNNEYYLTLYLLIVYSFNNQIRFNRKGEFNLPVGKRDFNKKMQQKLDRFIDRIKCSDYMFLSRDFRKINTNELTQDSFVYADPPYLITCASYNEMSGWLEKDEIDLLAYLDCLDSKGVKFALSNVIESKGKTNLILSDWLEANPKYKVIELDFDYSNSSYHKNDRDLLSREVLIVNY